MSSSSNGLSPTSGQSFGSLTGLAAAAKPNLNRELVTKLRGMTESLQMLSEENLRLKDENICLRTRLEADTDSGITMAESAASGSHDNSKCKTTRPLNIGSLHLMSE